MNPNHKVIFGTLGANRETRGGAAKTEGIHIFDPITNKYSFYDLEGHRFKTGMKLNQAKIKDLMANGNIM